MEEINKNYIINSLNASPFNKDIETIHDFDSKNSKEILDYIYEIVISIDPDQTILYNETNETCKLKLLSKFLELHQIKQEIEEDQLENFTRDLFSHNIKVLYIILYYCFKNYKEMKERYEYNKVAKSVINQTSSLYSIDSYINQGGYGIVLSGTKLSDNKQVALKFYGYGSAIPQMEWIEKEIKIILKLHNCDDVAKILGLFRDSLEGRIPFGMTGLHGMPITKKFKDNFPVIVMEKLCGGEVLDKICSQMKNNTSISEQHISTIFRNFILAVNEIHDKSDIIHCDYKAENIVFVNDDPNDFSLKIIDFGLALSLEQGEECEEFVIDNIERGSPGMVAPETLIYNDNNRGKYLYSRATDIWQTGCILYLMLNSTYPFKGIRSNYDTVCRERIKSGQFYDDRNRLRRSSEACDLVSKILTVDPNNRISGKEILNHPWISNNAMVSSADMGEVYRNNIKQWSYRKKLRKCLEGKIQAGKNQKESLKKVLFELSSRSLPSSPTNPNKRMKLDVLEISQECFQKLRLSYVSSFSIQQNTSSSYISSSEIATAIDHKGMDFNSFCQVLNGVDLGFMAKKEVFDIFDDDNSNYVDYFEFLIVLLPFRNDLVNINNNPLLFFEIFDIRGKGNITKSELMCVMSKLLEEEIDYKIFQFDEIFKVIDTSGDGLINFDEFERFINIIGESTL
jgi:serine/threonine protein kinase